MPPHGGVHFFVLTYPTLWIILARGRQTAATLVHEFILQRHFTAEYGREPTSELRSLGEVEVKAIDAISPSRYIYTQTDIHSVLEN
jgi:hypothetical protein